MSLSELQPFLGRSRQRRALIGLSRQIEAVNFFRFGCRMQSARNRESLGTSAPDAGDAGRARRMPPGFDFDGFGASQGGRHEAQEAVGDQAEGRMTLECSRRTLPAVGEPAVGFQLVEDVLDLEARRVKFQQAFGTHGEVGREKDVHLFPRLLESR